MLGIIYEEIVWIKSIYFHSANLFVLKAKRQLQKTTTSIGGEMNAVLFPVQWMFKHLLNDSGTQAKVATSKERCLNFCKKRRNTANRTLRSSIGNACMTCIVQA
ncbi:hypothetical protein MKY34_11545 [Sporosarcina sp. FSL K6-1522]|uniref:hypothetical protein n=1 Tax=Sporosarcina sp. FSL K6-1522 TaxID=2921554 RepID=UPI00315AD3DF